MRSLEMIRVPVPLFVALAYVVALFAPLCPVQVHVIEWSRCLPPPYYTDDICATESDRSELQPPILVAASGFSWKIEFTTGKTGTNYSFSANPAVAASYFFIPLLLTFVLMIGRKAPHSDAGRFTVRSHFVIKRRSLRALLWGTGFSLLLLSAFWAWGYLIFYVGSSVRVTCTATIDPLLTSMIATFLLLGLGFYMMILSIRARAIWPVNVAREE